MKLLYGCIFSVSSSNISIHILILGIYKMTLSDNKLGMTKEVIATKVLPFLFPLSIENGLTVLQYTAVMALVKVIYRLNI